MLIKGLTEHLVTGIFSAFHSQFIDFLSTAHERDDACGESTIL